MRLAEAADKANILAFLMDNAPIAMFPTINLLEHGLGADHQRAMTFWVNDPLTNVLGITGDGMVMPVFTSSQVTGLADALSGRNISGVVGSAAACASVKAALNLPVAGLNRDEPHYELTLSDLKMPDVDGLDIVPYTLASRDVLIAWRTAYDIEALEVRPADAAGRAIAHVNSALETDAYRVLMKGETPLAVTGFNAQLPDIVMIGGVFTPETMRGNGYAGKALALHLAQARAKGVKRAVLSAANHRAAKAYERIGFQKMGMFNITILDNPVTING